MNRYIVLHEDGCCGHKHRSIDQAEKCYNHFDRDRNVIMVTLPEKYRKVDPLWIDHCLLKHTSMREMAEALEG
jgi:hypothetical protein